MMYGTYKADFVRNKENSQDFKWSTSTISRSSVQHTEEKQLLKIQSPPEFRAAQLRTRNWTTASGRPQQQSHMEESQETSCCAEPEHHASRWCSGGLQCRPRLNESTSWSHHYAAMALETIYGETNIVDYLIPEHFNLKTPILTIRSSKSNSYMIVRKVTTLK